MSVVRGQPGFRLPLKAWMGCKERKAKRSACSVPSSPRLAAAMLLSFFTVSTSQSCPTAWLLASFKGNHHTEGGEAFKTEARTDIPWPLPCSVYLRWVDLFPFKGRRPPRTAESLKQSLLETPSRLSMPDTWWASQSDHLHPTVLELPTLL